MDRLLQKQCKGLFFCGKIERKDWRDSHGREMQTTEKMDCGK